MWSESGVNEFWLHTNSGARKNQEEGESQQKRPEILAHGPGAKKPFPQEFCDTIASVH
jgi:hypothetical protein